MQSSPSPARQFESLVQRVLEANGFVATKFGDPRGIGGFDFVGELAGETWAIEVKFYRTARAQVTLIESAAARLIHRAVSQIVRKYRVVLDAYRFDPQKVGKNEGSYDLVLDAYETELMLQGKA